jgi:diaminopropionate ammonia-lyase
MERSPQASQPLPWFARPQARSWTCGIPEEVSSGAVRAFHASLPGYAPTPLTEVPALAAQLAAAGISSGPSGAASLAGARAALTGPGSTARRTALSVDSNSVIVLLNTEAAHPT